LFCDAAIGDEIEIGSSLPVARQNLRDKQSKIAVDTEDGPWHLLVAQQEDRVINLLFEQDRLRYVSYDFYLGGYVPVQGSIAQCNAAFDAAVAFISKTHGTGDLKRVMSWPERTFTMTWHDEQRYAVAREVSDLDGCLLVKAFIFDGNEADFKVFDQRLSKR
jgi:hypothetical protein